jgi:hypothetical protein
VWQKTKGWTVDAKATSDFRIDLHVMSLGCAGSDFDVNVPKPSIAWLLASGLMGLGFTKRKQAECI